MEERALTTGTIVRHFKGNMYQILAIATHSETREKMVVYQALYGDYAIYVRPYDMFLSPVDRDKYPDVRQEFRFEIVKQEELLADKEEKLNAAAASVGGKREVAAGEGKRVTAATDYEAEAANSGVNHVLLRFLDADTPGDKIKVIDEYYSEITESILNSMEASLDVVGGNGNIDSRIDYLRTFLKTRSRYENLRLR